MQLNKTMKQNIIIGLASKALKEEGENLCAEVDAFITKAFDLEHKALNDSLKKKLTKEEIEQSFSYGVTPSAHFRTDKNRYSDYLRYPVVRADHGRNEVWIVAGKSNRASVRLTHYLQTSKLRYDDDVTIHDEHPLLAEYRDIEKKISEFNKRGAKLVTDLEAVILPQKTDTRLLELLPEAGEFIKAPVKTTDIVPIDTVKDIRKALGAAA